MTSLAIACRLGASYPAPSIPSRVRSILNKYGATMLLPGVSGALRFGYQPGNYRESTGQTLAAADQQVGLVVDAARGPGPELVVNGGFDSASGWVFAGAPNNWRIDDGILKGIGSGTFSYVESTVPYTSFQSGTRYLIEMDIVHAGVAANLYLRGSTSVTLPVTSGRYRVALSAGTGTSTGIRIGASGFTGSIDNVSVRELPGIHASQSTSGFQPILRNTSGIQSWQFDGTDDRLSLSAVPFQMADDHFVVAGVRVGAVGQRRTLFYVGGSVNNPMCPRLSIEPSGVVTTSWRGDSGTSALVASSLAVTAGSDLVATARRSGSVGILRLNGTQAGLSAVDPGVTTLTQSFVGCGAGGSFSYDFHNGHIHGVIFGKGAISDAELLTLERFIASLQGRNL